MGLVETDMRNHPVDLDNETEYPSKVGGKRCNRIKRSGNRCKNWAAPGFDYCVFHGAGRKNSKVREMRYGFKSKKLGELFNELCGDPDRLDLTGELALLRMCLSELTGRLDSNIDSENATGILLMTREVSAIASAMSRIEKEMQTSVTIEQIHAISDQFITIICKHIKDSRTLGLIQEDLERILIPNANSPAQRQLIQAT